MFNVFVCDEDKKELEDFYNNRSHQDSFYQYCFICGADREFIFDRCILCKSN